jgi:nicotinamide riboside kinase
MLIVNFYGAPSAGKSLLAARVFSELKLMGINAEFVSEYAKEKVYEENHKVFEHQLYLFAKQYYRTVTCDNKVDVIVTDSPLLLSVIYNKDARLGEEFNTLVSKIAKSFNTLDFFLERNYEFQQEGRIHTEEESNQISQEIKDLLKKENIDFIDTPGLSELSYILQIIKNKLRNDKNDS